MIFIFDWGYATTQNIGPLSADDASFDLKTDMVFLMIEKVWFRLFFIPMIVTERHYYFADTNSDKRQDIDKNIYLKYRDLASLNRQFMNDELSEEAYRKKRSQL